MTSTTSTGSPSVATGMTPARLAGLRSWNLGLTVLHAAQAVLVLVLAVMLPIVTLNSAIR